MSFSTPFFVKNNYDYITITSLTIEVKRLKQLYNFNSKIQPPFYCLQSHQYFYARGVEISSVTTDWRWVVPSFVTSDSNLRRFPIKSWTILWNSLSLQPNMYLSLILIWFSTRTLCLGIIRPSRE